MHIDNSKIWCTRSFLDHSTTNYKPLIFFLIPYPYTDTETSIVLAYHRGI